MPTYAYRCSACGHVFDAVEKITANVRTRKCPVCGKRAQRMISGGAGFLFKGEGFYITDYRSESYRTQAAADKEPAADKPAAAGKDAADAPAAGKDAAAGSTGAEAPAAGKGGPGKKGRGGRPGKRPGKGGGGA